MEWEITSSLNLVKGVDTMRINDELLEKLGIYFVYHEVYNKYGITFESFVDRWTRGILEI